MRNFLQTNPKITYLVIGLALIIVISAVLVMMSPESLVPEQTDNSSNNNSEQQARLPVVSISERAEVVEFGNEKVKSFDRVVLDPFLLEQGSTQQVVVVPTATTKVRAMKIKVKDGKGTKEKIMDLGKYNDRKAYFFKWQPKEIVSQQEYPIRFTSISKNSTKNSLTLSWQAK